MSIPAGEQLTVEIVLQGNIAAAGSNSRATANIFHYTRPASANPVSKVNLDTIFQSAIVVPLGLALNHRWLQSQNTLRIIDDPTDPPVAFAHAVAGNVAGDSMPSYASVYLAMKTGKKGRRYRGSKHFGPLSESDTTTATDDILNAASIVLWTAVKNAMLGCSPTPAGMSGHSRCPVAFRRPISRRRRALRSSTRLPRSCLTSELGDFAAESVSRCINGLST